MATVDVFEAVEDQREDLEALADAIWEHPELGLHEHRAADLLTGALDAAGFEVETGVADMPTAFVATRGDGRPRVGLLAEYDALPELSQRVSPERDPVEPGGPGHGCGHNLYGTAVVGAAIAVGRAIDAGDLDGSVVVFGCPAEETLVGKTYMARAGVFDDLDAALTWHPGVLNSPKLGASNALDSIEFTFHGVSAHAASAPEAGRSALDGVQLLNTGVEYMREHVGDDVRIHYAITEGGEAPNVVPATARAWYFVRAPSRPEVEAVTAWLRDVADGAASMSGTEVESRYLTGCHDFVANETLTDLLWENMRAVGPTGFDEADRSFAADLQSTIRETDLARWRSTLPDEVAAAVADAALHADPVPAFDAGERTHGSTEVGDVSYIAPTAQFRAATWALGTPAHTWQAVAANGSFGRKGMRYAAKVLAGTTRDLLADPEALAAAGAEFAETVGEDAYETPLPPDASPPFHLTARD